VSVTSASGDGQVQPEAGSTSGAVIGPPERPELAVGGAFAGGLVLALILKRLAR
jgi:hypothetical protein